ncbi:hypothetical protein ABB37_07462 [Leptomonas pyrrhocoris]|uniref:Uncharacterized protein n=1 Tax=Leptomonas pyrrhocoris TaxID=157538 RepID=A0A0M9FV23_LEPPY|nr:hypothetical protein ABB37_07462 [Leptomonas pyrrhocoris]KPA76593.1 hypothetical protein ABB37_07462 [Leptomonas pyrrhocoris]|eukprot:XP_015655032.1 hypothetical protein ABB37_07462 [Leptomonas pyrrhocoris]
MYTVKDASVAFSLMGQRLQPSNTPLLLDEYFAVCKLYGDTATARETHQRYVTQIESMRGIFTSQSLRNSEHEAFREDNGGWSAVTATSKAQNNSSALHSTTTAHSNDSSSITLGRRGNAVAAEASASASRLPTRVVGARQGKGENEYVPQHTPLTAQPAAATSGNDDESNSSKKTFSEADPSHHLLATALSEDERDRESTSLEGQRHGGDSRRVQASLHISSAGRPSGAGVKADASSTAAGGSTRNAASYAILRKEWGHENYEEQFHKPWNAFLRDMSGVMTEVVTAWVSDLDEHTPFSQHLIRRSSTCCYDAAHGMCLLRWNTMREVRAYVDALHAVVNAPLSLFFVPLTLGMQVLGVPVLCMSLAPVTGLWHGWDAVTVVWHSFCGLCANLRLMRPLDRAEGGRSETGAGPFFNGLAKGGGPSTTEVATSAPSLHTMAGTAGLDNALERSVAWSLLQQLEPATSANEYYGSRGVGVAPLSSYDVTSQTYASGAPVPRENRRNSVFRGDPTTLTNSVAGMVDRVSRQVFTSAAARQGGSFTRSGGLQLTPAIGADARWYFIDARAICLYQWYTRTSWMAARVPRREMFQSKSGCVQRSGGPNKLILQSKLRIMVGQLLNGLPRFNSNSNGSSMFASSGMHASVLLNESLGSLGVPSQRHWSRGKPPVLLSTLCHSHGVRYGNYVYAIVDLLRTEEASLDEAVQTAYRLGSSSPNKYELLKQCRRCIQAVVGELLARVIKHLIYQEWYMVIRQNPDWQHRFHSLCVAVAEAAEEKEEAATFAAASTTRAAKTAEDQTRGSALAAQKDDTAQENKLKETAALMATTLASTSAAEATFDSSDHNNKSRTVPVPAAHTEGESVASLPQEESESAASKTAVVDYEEEYDRKRQNQTAIESAKDAAAATDCEEEKPSEGSGASAAEMRRHLLAFIDETREALGAPLLDAVRRVLNGVFTVNMSSSNNNSDNGGGGVPPLPANLSVVEYGGTGPLELPNTPNDSGVAGNFAEQHVSPFMPLLSTANGTALSAAGASATESSNRFLTDEAGRSLATSSAQVLGGYPVLNRQLSAVAFRLTMFDELLLAVNEQYVVQPYSGNEKMSEWQLLHKRAPVPTRRSQYTRTPPVVGTDGGGGGGGNSGSGNGGGGGIASSSNNNNGGIGGSNGGESWLSRGASRSGLGAAAASAPVSPAPKRGRGPSSRLRGAIPVYYPAADEESIQVEAKELFPGWSLQCLEEMMGVPLVLRQNRIDVDSSFTGADALRALSPSLLSSVTLSSPSSSAYAGGQTRTISGAVAACPPLSSGCPLRSAVWGTTIELPLCLHRGSVEGALEYAQHQREIGIAIVSSGLSAPFIGQGHDGAPSTFWRERNPHMVYMGKLIQLHAADVRVACRGWAIMEDFDFIKQSDQPSDRMLNGAAGHLAWPRRRGLESPLAHRQRLARARGNTASAIMSVYNATGNNNGGCGGIGDAEYAGGELAATSANSEDTLAVMSLNASMHARLSLLNARVDLHEAMSSMWHMTECMENMNGSHVVYGYLLRQKIGIIATVAAQFTASGVTTALEAAIADLNVLTGGIFNFGAVDDPNAKSEDALLRPAASDDVAVSGGGRRVARSPGWPALRSGAVGSSSNSGGGLRARVNAASPFPLSPRNGESSDTRNQYLHTPLGSQTFTLDPSQQARATATVANGSSGDNTTGAPGAVERATSAPALSVDRLRSVPLPPPITQRQVAVVAAAEESVADTRAMTTATARALSMNGAGPTPLVGSIGAFKSFILRSVQCVDLYTTLLELLTRHMLLPDAHRTPKEGMSRAVMFCSLRRELAVMTHGENSVEAAMAASDVGLLLLQSSKTWPQAMTEFFRARRSITYHLRELAEDAARAGEKGGGKPLFDRQLVASAINLDPSALCGQFGSSVFAHDDRGEMTTIDVDRPLDVEGGHGAAASAGGTPTSVVAYMHGKGDANSAWAFVRRASWTTAPDRLKQALCSVLNNTAYLFCRQAQRQYVMSQQSMATYVRHMRRQNTLQKPSAGVQLYARRLRCAAKVEHFLTEAATTLQGVVHHASDVPVYDYAVALNNQACVLLHRYQYAAAKRLLLQSLRITMQLQSFSVAPVPLPVWLVSAQGSSEIGSVLWLLDTAQLPVVAGVGDVDEKNAALSKRSSIMVFDSNGARTTQPDMLERASMPSGGVASIVSAAKSCASPTFAVDSRAEEDFAHCKSTRAARYAPNALSTIAAMLKELGASLDEERFDAQGYYYATGSPPAYQNSDTMHGFQAASSSNAAALDTATASTITTTSSSSMLQSPITISSAEQLRNCQVHTLRMLYQLEVKKSFIDRLRIQQFFRRYLGSWRARRQQRRARAAEALYRFGAAALTRVYLARRYRFSGYHWWLRQPREIRRHLDPLLNQQSLSTRRQLWDVWNAQVEMATLRLQRVLRGSAVRAELGAQYQFQQFYLQRCRPAVEAAVWHKMSLLYTSMLLHLHVQEGLRGLSCFMEAVRSGAMWLTREMEPLIVQEGIVRVGVQLKELQRREALERDFYKTLFRQRLNQVQVAHMKESVLLVIRSPRPSFCNTVHAEPDAVPEASPLMAQQEQEQATQFPSVPPLALTATMADTEIETVAPAKHPRHTDIAPVVESQPTSDMPARQSARQPPPPLEMMQGSSAPLMMPPPCGPEEVPHRGSDGGAGHDYTLADTPDGNTNINGGVGSSRGATTTNPPVPPVSAPTSTTMSRSLFVPPSPATQQPPPTPTKPSTDSSRTRRARQVIIQAEADLEPSPRSTTASEERHRQMSRQYREDERAKMTQLLRRHMAGDDAEGDGVSGGGGVDSEKNGLDGGNAEHEVEALKRKEGEESSLPQESGSSVSSHPVLANTEDANVKWRHAMQRVAEPRTSFRSQSFSDRHSQFHRSLSAAWSSGNNDGGGSVLAPPQPGSPLSSHPEKKMMLPCPDSVVTMLPTPPCSPAVSSPTFTSSASSSSSSRMARVAAEVQRRQLLNASQLLIHFWWSKRALPTFVTSAMAMHRLYGEHCGALHELWRQEAAWRFRMQLLIAAETEELYRLWRSESLEMASLLLLKVHSARCCREVVTHAKLLATTLTTEERRGRTAVLLAAAARERRPPSSH